MTRWACAIIAPLCCAGTVAADGSSQRHEEPRQAVTRALPYLAKQTEAWIENNKCTSCHQVPHALWAMNSARTAGFEVDSRLIEWNRWATTFVLRGMDDSEETTASARDRADEAY
jgi:hypothetical protein